MPKRLDPADPREWLNRARSSLRHAQSRDEGVYLEELCFDAQQAVAKSLKALLVYRKIAFPKTHAIADLLTLAQMGGIEIPEEILQASELTEYAVEARYRFYSYGDCMLIL